jgi:hypothetical protein
VTIYKVTTTRFAADSIEATRFEIEDSYLYFYDDKSNKVAAYHYGEWNSVHKEGVVVAADKAASPKVPTSSL